jgi:hypothetical protein
VHPIVAADALLEIGTTVISAVFSLDEVADKHSCVQNFVTNRRIVLFGTFLLGYALINALRTAANDFDAKYVRE